MVATQPTPPVRPERPLSPHIDLYRTQFTPIVSILHRLTGLALAGGMVVFIAWLACLASGPTCYEWIMGLLTSPVGLFCLFGWTWSLFYHLSTGVRHLVWDTGLFLEASRVAPSGRIVIGVSVLLTLAVWLKFLGSGVCPWL